MNAKIFTIRCLRNSLAILSHVHMSYIHIYMGIRSVDIHVYADVYWQSQEEVEGMQRREEKELIDTC